MVLCTHSPVIDEEPQKSTPRKREGLHLVGLRGWHYEPVDSLRSGRDAPALRDVPHRCAPSNFLKQENVPTAIDGDAVTFRAEADHPQLDPSV